MQIKWLDVILALVGIVLIFGWPKARAILYEVVTHPLTPSKIPDPGDEPRPMRQHAGG